MPERLSISDFVVLTNEDLSSSGTSSFQSKMSDCRNTVSNVEEVRVEKVGGWRRETYTPLLFTCPYRSGRRRALVSPAQNPCAHFLCVSFFVLL
uniref:Uncharacterized protein n=1 Tax=Amphiprion percula TaxID=161767 RepID=A0A3P8TT87_AMPPE